MGCLNDQYKGQIWDSQHPKMVDLAMCGFDGFGVCHTTVIIAIISGLSVVWGFIGLMFISLGRDKNPG